MRIRSWSDVDQALARIRQLTDLRRQVEEQATRNCAVIQEKARERLTPLLQELRTLDDAVRKFLAEHLPTEDGRKSLNLPAGRVWMKETVELEAVAGITDDRRLAVAEKRLPEVIRIRRSLDWTALRRLVVGGKVAARTLARLGVSLVRRQKVGYSLTRVPPEVPR